MAENESYGSERKAPLFRESFPKASLDDHPEDTVVGTVIRAERRVLSVLSWADPESVVSNVREMLGSVVARIPPECERVTETLRSVARSLGKSLWREPRATQSHANAGLLYLSMFEARLRFLSDADIMRLDATFRGDVGSLVSETMRITAHRGKSPITDIPDW